MKQLSRLSKILVVALLWLGLGWAELSGQAYSTGPPAGHTGAPGEATCVACHRSYALNFGNGALTLSGLPTEYVPGQPLALTVTLAYANARRFGLQLTALDDAGRQAGSFSLTEATRTQMLWGTLNGLSRAYLEHTQDGLLANGSGRGVWQFTWTPPARSTGRVTFYLAANAANGNNTTTGDYIYTRSYAIQPTLAPLATVSAASFAAAPLAAEALAATFGTDLAAIALAATTTPLPTTLGGVVVQVRDSLNVERAAPLVFVAPTQLNYLVPAGIAPGAATVTVWRNGVAVAAGPVQIERLAPGLFAANANGAGWAAAVALRIKADGAQQFEPVAQFDAAQNRFVAVPLDLGPPDEQVFLSAFGTGWRYHAGLQRLSVEVGGRRADVTFAGAQGQLAGLDQLNLRLPRELAGRGEVELKLAVEDQTANRVKLWIK